MGDPCGSCMGACAGDITCEGSCRRADGTSCVGSTDPGTACEDWQVLCPQSSPNRGECVDSTAECDQTGSPDCVCDDGWPCATADPDPCSGAASTCPPAEGCISCAGLDCATATDTAAGYGACCGSDTSGDSAVHGCTDTCVERWSCLNPLEFHIRVSTAFHATPLLLA